MPDLLTTLIPDVLTTEVERIVLLEAQDDSDIFETVTESVLTEMSDGNEMLTIEVETHLLTEGVQGPPGAGNGIEKSTLVDPSRPVAYVAFSDRIVKLDYTTYPPSMSSSRTATPVQAWPNRTNLIYA